MHRDWFDFKSLHSNFAGAREAFETSCETLFRKIHENQNVQQVRVSQGDGGIDIFIGEFGVEPISVIQCKFFLENFQDSQKNQVRNSFKTSIESKRYELKDWILCMPTIFDVDQHDWWAKWKKKKTKEFSKSNDFIKLISGNALIDLFKDYDLYNKVFQINDSLLIKDTNKKITKLLKISENGLPYQDYPIEEKRRINNILFNNYSSENEKYYLEREIDNIFMANINLSNIWLFGKSGTGKTTLINRNMIKNKIDYIFCDMSSITIDSIDQIFDEIIFEIKDNFSCEETGEELNQIRKISKLLNSCKISDQFIIIIDELSISDINLLKLFSDKIIGLVNFYNNTYDNQYIRFVVSTINEPKEIICNKEKASEYFCSLNSNSWDDSLTHLFKLIIKALSIEVEESVENLVFEKSDGNPRLLKFIVRKIIISNQLKSTEIKEVTIDAVKEFYML